MKPTITASDVTCKWCGELIELMVNGTWAHLRDLSKPHEVFCHGAGSLLAAPATDDWCRTCGTREDGCDEWHPLCVECLISEDNRERERLEMLRERWAAELEDMDEARRKGEL